MNTKFTKSILLSSIVASSLFAGGYKVPENSLDAIALSSACIANANGADASYYNPANMAYNKASSIEVDVTYIALSKVDFKGTTTVPTATGYVLYPTDTTSESESFVIPTLHYVSPMVNNFNFGLSIVTPSGLSKKWEDQPASIYAEEFTLETVEINPTFSYKINDMFAIGGGLRALYSNGIVKNAYYDMEGDSWDFGYNLALSVRPVKNATIALTYRSKIDMDLEGDTSRFATYPIGSDGSVSLPLPATLDFAVAYTMNNTTVEVVVERTFWSDYEELDFTFDNPKYDRTFDKNWDDTMTYRLGLTHKYNQWTAMAGYAYDESPIPDETLGYELPSSDANIFSLGAKYQINEKIEVGLAGLMAIYDDRKVTNKIVQGEFSNSKSYLTTASIEYKF
ncbi:MAG: transporter [Epsilonproteobacteria bacterium]|nr:transporter [Campylobacterota bacterium]